MSNKIESKNGNVSMDLGTGELIMKDAEINKDFPKVFIGKERGWLPLSFKV